MIENKPIIRTDHDLRDHYYELFNLLAAYFAIDAEEDIFDTGYTIKHFCEVNNLKTIAKTIVQANDILAMDPFPIDAVSYAAGGLNTTQEWLRNVLHLLELRVIGQL